ncbi:MAG: ABC transporter permease [Acidobacteria bacterium]|nr:ABC transporter permease [Acidobacteriota bacterium]
MQEIRQAIRALSSRPSLVVVSVLTLALGIGGTTAVFSVVDAVLLRPLPFPRSDRLVSLTESSPNLKTLSVSWQNYVDWRDQSRSFESVAAYRSLNVTITGEGEPERVPAKMVSAAMLPMLGVKPSLGRGFTKEEDQAGGEPVALISEGLWTRRFARDPRAVGQVLTIDNTARTIVGVLPASFVLVQPADVLIPIGPWASTLPDDRGWHPGIFPLARLKNGVELGKARLEMAQIAKNLERQYPETNLKVGADVTPLQQQMVQNVQPALAVLLGAVVLVLLIACANVANLLLVRTIERRREIAVRAALGARRWRLVRHVLSESLVLALAGGLLGVLVASWAVSALVALAGPGLPRADSIAVDQRVLLFALALSTLTALAFGAAPAVHASRADIREALNEEGRGTTSAGSRRLARAFVVAEVALATTLLVGAGLLLRSFVRLQQVPPGFSAARLLVADLPLSPIDYAEDAARERFVDRLLEHVTALPGVEAAGTTTTLPMAGSGALLHFNIYGRPPKGPEDYILAGYRAVSPTYLAALGVPTLRGRSFTEWDRSGSKRVVVINETMAKTFFKESDPLGQRISIGTEPDEESPWMEVVGVVGDVRQGFEADPKAEMYVSYLQGAPHPVLAGLFRSVSVVVRAKGDPLQVAGGLRGAVAELDRNQPVVKMRTMEQAIGATVAQPRFRTMLVALFALVALLLAAIGVYGVMAYGVTQRAHELGVRMALGAADRHVVRLVLVESLALTALGVCLGLAGGAAATRLLAGLLFETRPLDPPTFLAVPLVLAAIALAASYVPARRALRVEPAVVLR